jgi:hypothetical protein
VDLVGEHEAPGGVVDIGRGIMKNKKGMVKTEYCFYWLQCDREEDCFHGAYCPVYQFNPNCKTKEEASYDYPDQN